ncbi:DUF6702 family protein [Flavobacterium tibetense]|uniref:Peptidase E n=1 Tax=Flavobacterium tibetense TaxID=2233533 RepID=A0A365P4N0_9FLAO|nr:DUF6702 family protein [Flavobacterium tibetense]RBA29522.1 hypothetical protein DPN68_02425 [Flavobacterium tibetense]
MKLKYKIVVFGLFLTLSAFTWHKFYVSVTEVAYSEDKNRIEISTRIFIDDLEKGLEKKYNKKINLATKEEIPEAKDFIKGYVSQRIQANVNNKTAEVVFLGFETENDVLICYLKIDFSEKITTFELYNNMLTEIYADQQNLVHTNINNTKRSFLLTKTEKTALIKY